MTKLIFTLLLSLPFLVQANQVTDSIAPEDTFTTAIKQSVSANKFMVVTANPKATEAGYEVLKDGGTAVDAMVAIQTVLGLVEPQSSGLGGGAFAVYFDATTQQITTFDGRETAPLAATPELFQDENGKSLKFFEAVVGGRSVGTPGTVKLLEHMHSRFGVKDWDTLFKPAISLAKNGFEVSPRMANSIARDKERLLSQSDTADYFFDDNNEPLEAGFILKNKAYAHTLKTLAKKGAEGFYQGKIAKDIIDKITQHPTNPGVLSTKDFDIYEVKERAAVCAEYLVYSVCGMGPPSSGALTVGQILGITQQFDLKTLGNKNPIAWQIIGDASRLAFADRGRYMADTDYVPMPSGLLEANYLKRRANLITKGKALTNDMVTPGEPAWNNNKPVAYADDQSIELPSTSHFVVVDSYGNVLSVTSTIENGFGSRLMSNGFLLNNELTDFSFASHKNGHPIANRVEPGKRPRSSMSPTIVMKDDKPYLAIGSPGGSRIIPYVANNLINILLWEMDIQEAINSPHLTNRFGTFDLEKGTSAEEYKMDLEKMGFKVNIRDLNSGLHGILITDDGLTGGADPRREGLVMGD